MSTDAIRATEGALQRISDLDPTIRAFAYCDPDDARRRAALLGEGSGRPPPLSGLTVGIKDIIDVKGMPTRYGWHFAGDEPAASDATVVSRLVAAGAVIMGKTKTAAYACWDPPDTGNPWDTTRTPGGSSSGSAAAVAAGMVDAALGTQTAGSVIRPASYCGVVGFVPSPDIVSRAGVFPLSPTFDRVGFMARTVDVVAAVFEAGVGRTGRGRTGPVAPSTVAGLRFGRLSGLVSQAGGPMQETLEGLVARLLAGGAHVVKITDPADLATVLECHSIIMRSEAAVVHADAYRASREGYPPKLSEVIERGLATSAPAYLTAQAARADYARAMSEAMRDVDAVLAPAAVDAAPRSLASTGDPRMSVPAMVAGLPAVTLPFGLDADGMPLGIQVMGHRGGDGALLSIARLLESLVPSETSLRASGIAGAPLGGRGA